MRFKRRPIRSGTTVFFATDLHGSEVCFRKFIAAATFYGADVLILGGDLTGKFVVPIVEQDGAYRTELFGKKQSLAAEELERFEADCARQGLYARRMSADEYGYYANDRVAADALFEEMMNARLVAWLEYAQARLGDTGIKVLTAPGNDDPFEIDAVIREHGGGTTLLVEGEIYEVAPGHEMLNIGWSNPTPWHTHREEPEEKLGQRIERIVRRLQRPESAVFNIHVPPYDSGLDTGPMLDEDLKVVTSMGGARTGPVGSTAVREAITNHQPLVSLHGHIHESGGAVRIGRTVSMNAGSEYADGVLRGILLTVAEGELVTYQQTTG
jgi:Icc-related predicted phosphoesterase